MAIIVVQVKFEGTSGQRKINKGLGELFRAQLKRLECEDHGEDARAIVTVRNDGVEATDHCCNKFVPAIQARIMELLGG